MGVGRIDLIATAAVREADDGPAFCKTVERLCGHPVRLLSGEEEAKLSALGVIAGNPRADGIMGDLGGGRLELVEVTGGRVGHLVTLPLGPPRLMASYGSDRQKARPLIDKVLATVAWLGPGKARAFSQVGGHWRPLAILHPHH